MSTVKELMGIKGADVWSVHPQDTVYKALEIMAEKNIGALTVMNEDRLVGIFSERDYARKVILKGKSSKDTPISELMTENVLTIHSGVSLNECMKLMAEKHIRHLPVIDDKRMVGILTIGDVVNHIISMQQDTIQHLEQYIEAR